MKDFTAKVNFGTIGAQLIIIRAQLEALTKFVSRNATDEEKKELKEFYTKSLHELAQEYNEQYGVKEDSNSE